MYKLFGSYKHRNKSKTEQTLNIRELTKLSGYIKKLSTKLSTMIKEPNLAEEIKQLDTVRNLNEIKKIINDVKRKLSQVQLERSNFSPNTNFSYADIHDTHRHAETTLKGVELEIQTASKQKPHSKSKRKAVKNTSPTNLADNLNKLSTHVRELDAMIQAVRKDSNNLNSEFQQLVNTENLDDTKIEEMKQKLSEVKVRLERRGDLNYIHGKHTTGELSAKLQQALKSLENIRPEMQKPSKKRFR